MAIIKEEKPKLSYNQWGTVISRFHGSIIALARTGDYPEKKEDQKILKQLTYFQFDERET